MTGAEFKELRERLELGRTNFALLLGYLGSDENNKTRIRRLEEEEQVPLYIGKLAWLILRYSLEHNGNLPSWPTNLRIEGDYPPWI